MGDWQVVQRRRRKHAEITTFFVTNLPEGISDFRFKELFSNHGVLVDSYIARKRDRAGNVFGFLWFQNVREVRALLSELNGTKVDGAVLTVRIAKYGKPGHEGKETTNKRPVFHSGNHGQNHQVRIQRKNHTQHGSYMDAVMKNQNARTVNLPSRDLGFTRTWKKYSLYGETKNIRTLNEIIQCLESIGSPMGDVRYIGGLNVLITFPGTSMAKEFLTKHEEQLSIWFNKIQIWDGQIVGPERIAKIKVYGAPIHLWDPIVFEEIGKAFGKVLVPPSISDKDGNLSTGELLVLTQNDPMIDERIILKWRDQSYPVKVIEEMVNWEPSFLDNTSNAVPENQYVGNHPVGESDVSPVKQPNAHHNDERKDGEIQEDDMAAVDANKNGDLEGTRLGELNRHLHDGWLKGPDFMHIGSTCIGPPPKTGAAHLNNMDSFGVEDETVSGLMFGPNPDDHNGDMERRPRKRVRVLMEGSGFTNQENTIEYLHTPSSVFFTPDLNGPPSFAPGTSGGKEISTTHTNRKQRLVMNQIPPDVVLQQIDSSGVFLFGETHGVGNVR